MVFLKALLTVEMTVVMMVGEMVTMLSDRLKDST